MRLYERVYSLLTSAWKFADVVKSKTVCNINFAKNVTKLCSTKNWETTLKLGKTARPLCLLSVLLFIWLYQVCDCYIFV